MGDVFDALNRAEREREEEKARRGGQPAEPAGPEAPKGSGPDDDQAPAPAAPAIAGGALPLSQVQDQAATDVTAPAQARQVAASRTSVEETETDQVEDQPLVLPRGGRTAFGEPTLNGYAPEVVVHHDRGSLITEQYRAIRTQILARARNRRLQTHVVTSSAPEEGKTVTTVNLGITFTELRNQNSIIVEGDLRRPSFHKLFDRECTPGLVQLLRGDVTDIDEVIHPTVYDNLQFLPAGGKDFTHSTELLSSPRMTQVLEQLRDRYDHIFIDTPPVITVTDASILGSMCDQTVLVVRLHKTPTEAVDRAKRLLRAANCELAGVILTHMQYHIPRYLYRYL